MEPHHGRGMVRRGHGDAGRDEARPRLRSGFGPGGAFRRRHAARAAHPRHRRLGPGAGGAGEDQGRDVRERRARRDGRRRPDRAVPGRLLVARRAARPPEAHPGRGDGHRRRAAPAAAIAPSAAACAPAGRQEAEALLDRRHPVSGAHRDPAHHRLGHDRLGQDGADLRSGLADPRARRALRDLRQDGELHARLLRSGPRRADEPARCPRAEMVALPRSPQPARLRHDGRRADSPAEGHGRPVLGDGGAPALLQRRRGVLEEGRARTTRSWSTTCSRPT